MIASAGFGALPPHVATSRMMFETACRRVGRAGTMLAGMPLGRSDYGGSPGCAMSVVRSELARLLAFAGAGDDYACQ